MAITACTGVEAGKITLQEIEPLLKKSSSGLSFSYDTITLPVLGTTGVKTEVLKVAKSDLVGVRLYIDRSDVVFSPFFPRLVFIKMFRVLFSSGYRAQSKKLALELALQIKETYSGNIMEGKW